jgi:hypothetical protein
MSEVTRYNKLSMDNLQFEKPENKGTVYFGNMLYDLNPLLLQSSRLKVKEIKEIDKQKYLIIETDTSDFSFYDKLVKLDDHILEKTYQNSEEWFNKELPMDILENMYKRITSPFKKDETPSIQFKIPYHKENIQTKVYNQANEIIDVSTLVPGSTIISMVQVKGLKFLKQIYYCDLFLSQIKLINETVTIKSGHCLIEDAEGTEGVVDDSKTNDGKYDYEILDEEVIQKSKEIEEMELSISERKQIIENEQSKLSKLEEQLQFLK